jgi:hypothetical protein
MQMDELDMVPDYEVNAPSALPDILSANRIERHSELGGR